MRESSFNPSQDGLKNVAEWIGAVEGRSWSSSASVDLRAMQGDLGSSVTQCVLFWSPVWCSWYLHQKGLTFQGGGVMLRFTLQVVPGCGTHIRSSPTHTKEAVWLAGPCRSLSTKCYTVVFEAIHTN